MIVRQSQVIEMDNIRAQAYYRELRVYYRTKTPDLVNRFTDPQLDARIAAAVPKARAWGIQSADGILHYVTLTLTSGPNFDQDPKVVKYMATPGSIPDRKIRRLTELVRDNLDAIVHPNE